MGFVKLLAAWTLSLPVYAALIQGWYGKRNAAGGFVEAFLGLGILLALPSFLFALIVGWPAMSALAGLSPDWLLPPLASALFGLLMWMLAALAFPSGWRGAGYALAGHAAVLGLVWGCLILATTGPDRGEQAAREIHARSPA